MADCISLIDTLVDIDTISSWVQVSQMTNILHTEAIDILSVAGGYLQIEPFAVPDLDCRVVRAIVYHCCNTGAIHSFTDEPFVHITQVGTDTFVDLSCWNLTPKQRLADPVYTWSDDPCIRLRELRACQLEWLKEGKKTSWAFRDSSGTKTFLSERCLKDLIAEAEAQCEIDCGINTRCIKVGCSSGYCR